MKWIALTCCLCLLQAGAFAPGQAVPAAPSDSRAAPRNDGGDGPAIKLASPESEPPVIMPTFQQTRYKPPPRPPTGPLLIDHLADVTKDSSGKWWTVKDAKGNALSLLPCNRLETIEQRQNLGRRYRLSGEIFHYRNMSYLLVGKMLAMEVAREAAPAAAANPPVEAVNPPPAVAPPAPATVSAPSRPPSNVIPTKAGVSAEEVARTLLRDKPGKPVIPITLPPTPPDPGPSVPPPGDPLKPGPGPMLIDRLARLTRPADSDWFMLAFEADNTLREPPMRVLPNEWLEHVENETAQGNGRGVIFHISGEVHRYRGTDYVLIRSAIRKRELDQF